MKLLKCGAAMALAFGFSGTAQAQNLELALALDSSGSVGAANFALQRNAHVLGDLTVRPRDGTVAIGAYQFASNVNTIFAMQTITNVNHGALIAAIAGMVYGGGSTNISGAINVATADILGNAVSSNRQLIDVSTDGVNNVGNLATARANALAAGIDQFNCIGIGIGIGIGAGANCAPVQAGVGSFSLQANDFAAFERALRAKIVRQARGVSEPATWAMLLLGFSLVGAFMRRKPQMNSQVRFAF